MEVLPEGLISAAYQTFLGRSPDPDGLAAWVRLLNDGLPLEQFFLRLQSSEEYISQAASFCIDRLRREKSSFMIEHSQYGEIQMLVVEMVNSASACRTVVDVGARGVQRSNSYDLLKHFGWRGILVEANPRLGKQLEIDFQGLNVDIVSAAVANYSGEADFFIGDNFDVSSLNLEVTESWGDVSELVRVSVRRLHEILEEHHVPIKFDLLSLDIEGEDVKVLNDLIENTSYRPNWIIVEASYNFQTKTLEGAGFSDTVCCEYEIRGQTVSNLILALRESAVKA